MTGKNFSIKQIQAMDLLALGVPHSEVAKKIEITTRQISAWKTDDDFVRGIDKRRNEIFEKYEAEKAAKTEISIEDYIEHLEKYKRFKIDVQQEFTALGLEIARKVGRRLADLPDEAVTVAMIPNLVRVAIDCVDEGTGAWAELIGVERVFRQAKERGSQIGNSIH